MLRRIKRLKHIFQYKAPVTVYGREYVISLCSCGKAKIKGPLRPVQL